MVLTGSLGLRAALLKSITTVSLYEFPQCSILPFLCACTLKSPSKLPVITHGKITGLRTLRHLKSLI